MAEKVLPDEFRNGVRLFNPTKPYGTIYSDAQNGKKIEAKWDQEGVLYGADRLPLQGDWAKTKRQQKAEAENASGAP